MATDRNPRIVVAEAVEALLPDLCESHGVSYSVAYRGAEPGEDSSSFTQHHVVVQLQGESLDAVIEASLKIPSVIRQHRDIDFSHTEEPEEDEDGATIEVWCVVYGP